MRISLRSMITLITLSVLLGSVALRGAQRLGGYKEADKDSPEVGAAAEFAVKEQSRKQELTYKLVSIDHAESQIVAGVNYRLCLKVGYHKEDDDVDTTEFVRTVVYMNLKKEYSLTSWVQEDCGEDKTSVNYPR